MDEDAESDVDEFDAVSNELADVDVEYEDVE